MNYVNSTYSVVPSNCLPQRAGLHWSEIIQSRVHRWHAADLVWSGLATRYRETVRVGCRQIKLSASGQRMPAGRR